MENVYCVIMAGGVGSRFWPVSTTNHPKQFIDILGVGETLLQSTFRRFSKFVKPENIYIVTNSRYYHITKEQLPEINDHQILLEPAKRNTAPCICYATCKILKKDTKAQFIVTPSDHLIINEEEFSETIKIALDESRQNAVLCTLGIEPHSPSTSYGYIQFRENKTGKDSRVKKVKSFTEKPDLDHAKAFLESGDFLWNSGIFIWSGKAVREAFEKYLPDMLGLFMKGWNKYYTEEESAYIDKVYPLCENESVDYGILEKAKNVFVVPSKFGWNDLGTWGSLFELKEKDKTNNAVINNNAILYNSKDNIISVSKDKVVVVDGLEGYIVVESEDRLLIVQKSKEESIRNIVNDVKVKMGDKYI